MDKTVGRLVYKILGDDRDFQRTLTSSSKALQNAGRKMTQIGTRLTLGVTVPIVGIGTAMVKAAVDAEETRAKFETAFRGITNEADEVRDALTEGYGLANDEAERLLSNTGDLLKGFGASANEALGLSNQVQQLAVDLASYNNLQGGTERASQILTKAMLGQREALTSLGIKISETDVQQRLLENGQEDLTGRSLLLAKAQATLELAYSQSGDALGDFNRTQDSTANQFRQLQAEIRDLSVEIGKELLPIARELLTWARDTITQFNALDDSTKKLVLAISGIAAAAGPATTAIGGLLRGAGLLKGALAFLGPGGWAVAGVGALAGAFWVASEPISDMEQKAEMFAESLRQASNQGMDLEEVINEIAKRGDVSAQELRQMAIEMGIATEETRKAYRLDQRRAEYAELQLDFRRWEAEAAERVAEAEKTITQEKREQERLTNWQEYWEDVNERWRDLGQNLSIYRTNLDRIKQLDDPQRQIEELERLEQMLALDIGMLEQEEKFPITAEARLTLLNEIRATMESITGETDEGVSNADRMAGAFAQGAQSSKDMSDNIAEGVERLSPWEEYIRGIKEEAASMEDHMVDVFGALESGYGDIFKTLGKGLVDGQKGFESLISSAKRLGITILTSLAEEMIARSIIALATGNFAAAAAFGAGAAGAYTSVGVISALASGGDFTVDEPTIALMGENGPEHVTVKPIDNIGQPGSSGVNLTIYGDVLDPDTLVERLDEWVSQGRRTGRVSNI